MHSEVKKTELVGEQRKMTVDEKESRKQHEKEMENLRHKHIMAEINAMGKNKVTHFNRRS